MFSPLVVNGKLRSLVITVWGTFTFLYIKERRTHPTKRHTNTSAKLIEYSYGHLKDIWSGCVTSVLQCFKPLLKVPEMQKLLVNINNLRNLA